MIAALYVHPGGCYFGLPDVEPWDEARDARRYAGPWPVVAHPPCERWGRYARGGPNPNARRREVGDDAGCFAAAIAAVRQWGGVLEHPEASHAWRAFGLLPPPRGGGWVAAGDFLGWTCCVEQGHYGHRARKATWLYVCSARARAVSPVAPMGTECGSEDGDDHAHRGLRDARPGGAGAYPAAVPRSSLGPREWVLMLPSLTWGPSNKMYPLCRLDVGYHSKAERRRAQKRGTITRMGKRQAAATPVAFRDLLLSIARQTGPREVAA